MNLCMIMLQEALRKEKKRKEDAVRSLVWLFAGSDFGTAARTSSRRSSLWAPAGTRAVFPSSPCA